MASFGSAVIGAVSSSLANVTVYPLDLSKSLLQGQLRSRRAAGGEERGALEDGDEYYEGTLDCIGKVFRQNGFFGLYRGMGAALAGNFVQTFLYFLWYNVVRRRYFRLRAGRGGCGGSLSTVEELGVGVVAAGLSQLFTNPISLISTRQQTAQGSRSADVSSVVRSLYKESGNDFRCFWKGFKVSLVLSVNPAITYTAYQKIKSLLFASGQVTAIQNFLLGVVSKMISTVTTQPLIVSKTVLQSSNSKFASFHQVLCYLYTEEGLLALWKGLGPQLAKGVLVQGLLFMFHGEITKGLRRIMYLRANVLKPQAGKTYVVK